jgi:hypothetical protein
LKGDGTLMPSRLEARQPEVIERSIATDVKHHIAAEW